MMDKLNRGPFISNFGIKLHDPLFHYDSGIAKMRSLTSKVISGKRAKLIRDIVSVDKEKTAERKSASSDDPTKPVDVSHI